MNKIQKRQTASTVFYIMWRKGALFFVLIAILAVSSVYGQQSNHKKSILLGMSTALSGPARDLGLNMRTGVLAAFAEANREGGINGKKLELIALDDGYEPDRTAPNMWELIKQKQVVAIIGNVGTPTAVTAIPIANRTKTPFLGAFTGAGVLRKSPVDRYVINYRASYAEETAAMVDALIKHGKLEPTEIAFFTQRDAYGDAGYIGGIKALKHHGLTNTEQIAHGRYERNTLAVENGLADILQSAIPPRAIIMVGSYGPCARFISMAKEFGFNGIFLNVSFVGTASLAQALGKDGDGVIITQVVPHFSSDLPILKAYRKAVGLLEKTVEPTFGSLEGYITGTIFIRAVKTIQDEITREKIISALESLGEFDIGLGEILQLGSTNHQACHTVWPSILQNGKAVPFVWNEI